MKRCPICDMKREDDRFTSRQFSSRVMPVCSQCFDSWRTKQREMAYESNRASRKLEEIPAAPWQLGTYDVSAKKGFSRNEKIEYMLKKAGIRLPTNPQYLGR